LNSAVDTLLKKMNRCYIPLVCWQDKFIEPDAHSAHYLVNVLRLKKGDKLVVFNGIGREVVGEISSITHNPHGLRIAILHEIAASVNETQIDFTLLQAVPKGNKMDWIVEKTVELGVTTIIPLITERGIVRFEEKKAADNKVKRWQRIAESAARQCGCSIVPQVKPVSVLQDALHAVNGVDFFAVGSLASEARLLMDVMAKKRSIKSMALLIGPEGDLTFAEYDSALKAGAIPVTFGRRVLRVETAAICGIAVMMFCASGGKYL